MCASGGDTAASVTGRYPGAVLTPTSGHTAMPVWWARPTCVQCIHRLPACRRAAATTSSVRSALPDAGPGLRWRIPGETSELERAAVSATRGWVEGHVPGLQTLVVSFTDYLYEDHITRPAARLPELKAMLLEPLADAFAPLASTQKQPFVVELPIAVFDDLIHLKCFATEAREHHFVEGWEWLRYPIARSDKELFYYIKQGTETGLFWDYQGRPGNYGHHSGHLVLS
ncbi:uncharacterized protein J7T54_004398 [Emericellopsis cladophorae]|uniref:Uncharacterized protein n=1 Tax=Emericellopsis cladophorae TaxID=2686198 RepID=A0A9P9Y4L0_9HYPO|nr:uncharacterized protein J7T54_004398 [Emericellopsis cladophorae]KAI6783371.1 hypothetical protein J7T54_004398 [Emericellopsis cladophorae]